MVRNYIKIKKEKARMVINYKVLNKENIFDRYFPPNKKSLISKIRVVEWFSKLIASHNTDRQKWMKNILNMQLLVHLRNITNG